MVGVDRQAPDFDLDGRVRSVAMCFHGAAR
jgi:hypothetical protein